MDVPTPEQFKRDFAEEIKDAVIKGMKTKDAHQGCFRYIVHLDDPDLYNWDVICEVAHLLREKGWEVVVRTKYDADTTTSIWLIWSRTDACVPVEGCNHFRWVDPDEHDLRDGEELVDVW